MIAKKKILIYDSSRGYSRFIKLNFKEFDIKSFFEYNNYKDINYDEFFAIFFIVNQTKDLLDFIWIYKKIDIMFLGTPLVEINKRMKDFEDIIILDLEKKRQEILDLIRFNFKYMEELDNAIV